MKLSNSYLLLIFLSLLLGSCVNNINTVTECLKSKGTVEGLSILDRAKNTEDSLIKYNYLAKGDIQSYKNLIQANFENNPIPDSTFYSRNIDDIEIIAYPSTATMMHSCLSLVQSDTKSTDSSLEYKCFNVVRLMYDTGISDIQELDFFFDTISKKDLDDPVVKLVLMSLVFLGG